jgi:hypothetical protein
MTLDPEKIAERLGATHFAELPDVGGGAFGMAHMAQRLKERLDARGARGSGTGVGWIMSSKVPMSAETERLLIALAEKLSTPERRVNPMQLACQLLEESVQRLAQEKTP